jgi:hypothetical protein
MPKIHVLIRGNCAKDLNHKTPFHKLLIFRSKKKGIKPHPKNKGAGVSENVSMRWDASENVSIRSNEPHPKKNPLDNAWRNISIELSDKRRLTLYPCLSDTWRAELVRLAR